MDKRGPGLTRGIKGGILEAGASRENLGCLEGETPVGRERSIGPLVTGHAREVGVTWEMAPGERQWLDLALREERMPPRGAYP